MASIEEKVEEHYKKILDELGIRHYGKTESIRSIASGDKHLLAFLMESTI